MSTERQGELFILLESFLWAWTPVLTIFIAPYISPLWALFFNTFFALIFFTIIIFVRKNFGELRNKKAYKDLFWASFWIMVLFLFYFAGLEFTSASNASLILFLQILFAFFYFNLFKREPISHKHLIGALFMTIGAIIVLFPKDLVFNLGDLLVLGAAMSGPVANRYQQRARRFVSAQSVLFVRSILSLPFLAIIAYALGGAVSADQVASSFWILLISGFVLMGISKIFWVEGIYRISITKASALTASGPIFTMFFAYLLLHETPTILQAFGIVPILIGAILITQRG